MTNEEIKKKICKIIADNYLPKEMPDRLEDYKLYRFKRAAEALIAAGLCDKNTLDEKYQTLMAAGFVQLASLRLDLEKVLHRAEVAEKAFDDLADEIYQHDVRPICDKEFFKQARFEQAERELAEEGKDDK